MATASSKRVVFEQREPAKCSHFCPRFVYDEPYTFRVRSQRSPSHPIPCDACLKEAKRQQTSRTNIQYQKRCSRLPPTPDDFEHLNRPNTSPSKQTPNNCNWDNFMKKKSKYAIQTPYALCNLTNNEQDSENRPPFVNYGGRCHDKQYGQKRTFNSLAVHQLKHQEVDEEHLKRFLREQRLRHQAENYFREMERRKVREQDTRSTTAYRNNSRSSQD